MLVCTKALEAAASVLCTSDLALEVVLLFISALPREATDYGGERSFLHFMRTFLHPFLLLFGASCINVLESYIHGKICYVI